MRKPTLQPTARQPTYYSNNMSHDQELDNLNSLTKSSVTHRKQLSVQVVKEQINTSYVAQVKIHHLETKNKELTSKIDSLEQSIKSIQSTYVKRIQDLSVEILTYSNKVYEQDNLIKKIREKKKDYKQRVVELCQQVDAQQNIPIPIQTPFAQLLEMRQTIIQLRLQTHLFPLIQAQERVNQFQNSEASIDMITYDEVFEHDQEGLSRMDIKRIHKQIIILNDQQQMCAVCQSDMLEGEYERKLSCSHSYHSRCIKGWLLIHKTCPLCKVEVSVPP